MPKHRKFIENKKNAVTYHVMNCPKETSYDEDAPKTIWVPQSEYSASPILPFPPKLPENKPLERIFPSKGPHPDWDPDVVAALDEDFNYSDASNILDDDFIAKANALSIKDGGDENSENEEDDYDDSDVDSDDLFLDNENMDELTKSLFRKAIANEKKKSAPSLYSMTSAVSNCSESIKTFNERFEKILESYEEDEIGALDGEDIEGHFPNDEFLEELCREKPDEELVLGNYEETLKNFILNYIEKEPEEKYVDVVIKGKLEYDCESILSTTSNIYNHPEVIKIEHKKKNNKNLNQSSTLNLKNEDSKQMIGKEKNEDDFNDSKEKNSDNDDEEKDSDDSEESYSDGELNERCSAVCSVRQKNETSEERRTRKKILKLARKEQRVLKKETKIIFKDAKKKLTRDEINLRRRSGLKLV